MIIRTPCHADIESLVDMGACMHAESAYAFLPYDRAKVRQFIEDYIEDTTNRCGLVAEHEGRVIAMLFGYLGDYLFCDERLAVDEIVFVDPDHRGGMTAVRLIRRFQRWASERGARELCLGVSTNIHPQSTGQLYQRLGFKPVGGIYKLRLNDR